MLRINSRMPEGVFRGLQIKGLIWQVPAWLLFQHESGSIQLSKSVIKKAKSASKRIIEFHRLKWVNVGKSSGHGIAADVLRGGRLR